MTKSKSFLFALFICGAAASVCAAPYNTVIVDGLLREYGAVEWVGTNTMGPSGTWGDHVDVQNLFVTWDDTYLYVALEGFSGSRKMGVFIDAQPGAGKGAVTTTNWVNNPEGYIGYNSAGWRAADPTGIDFGMDYFIINQGSSGFNNILQILYDGIEEPTTNNVIRVFDEQNGGTPTGGAVDMATRTSDECGHAIGFEARIPWSVFYADNAYGTVLANEVVPRNASIRLFATVFNNENDSAVSKNRKIPDLQLSEWFGGIIESSYYIDVVIDGDGDGFPDNLAPAGNPPYLLTALGKATGTVVYARFNQPVTEASATDINNWDLEGLDIDSISLETADAVYIYLNDPLPASGDITITADGVESVGTGSRESFVCFTPVEDGLDEPILVRFVLDTNSGMGVQSGSGISGSPAHRATDFFINGDFPLDWGYPPAQTTPIDEVLSGSLRYVDVIYPPGSPLEVNYKFSALLPDGTNNYEAVRLADYDSVSRVLTLDPDAPDGIMYVTNRLGAAAGPLRQGDDGYNALYTDNRRGDAGVSERIDITFRLDLSEYDHESFQRIFIQGTDPLRGFNRDNLGISDWQGGPPAPMNIMDAGLEMQHVGGGIYELHWALTPNGQAPDLVEWMDHCLVSGSYILGEAPPYGGLWRTDRTPRSFKYQYYIINSFGDFMGSPGGDIEVYIEPGAPTGIEFDLAEWAGLDPDLPLDPADLADPTNAPIVTAISGGFTNFNITYENLPDQRLHVIDVTYDLASGWRDHGLVMPFANAYTAQVELEEQESVLFARVRAARGRDEQGVRWSPNPIPETGGVTRIYFRQDETDLAGNRRVNITGNFRGWDGGAPMTFAGEGLWYYDLEVPDDAGITEFKFRTGDTWWGQGPTWDGNYLLYRGIAFATWDPLEPLPGDTITVTYDAAGGPLETADPVYVHLGFDEGWDETESREMTHVSGTVWEYSVEIPEEFNTSVNFVFNDGDDEWHSEGDGIDGRAWRAFLGPFED